MPAVWHTSTGLCLVYLLCEFPYLSDLLQLPCTLLLNSDTNADGRVRTTAGSPSKHALEVAQASAGTMPRGQVPLALATWPDLFPNRRDDVVAAVIHPRVRRINSNGVASTHSQALRHAAPPAIAARNRGRPLAARLSFSRPASRGRVTEAILPPSSLLRPPAAPLFDFPPPPIAPATKPRSTATHKAKHSARNSHPQRPQVSIQHGTQQQHA